MNYDTEYLPRRGRLDLDAKLRRYTWAGLGTIAVDYVVPAVVGAVASYGVSKAATPNTKTTGASSVPGQQDGVAAEGLDFSKLLAQAQQPQQNDMTKLKLQSSF